MGGRRKKKKKEEEEEEEHAPSTCRLTLQTARGFPGTSVTPASETSRPCRITRNVDFAPLSVQSSHEHTACAQAHALRLAAQTKKERKKGGKKERKKGGQGDEPAAEGVELWRLLLVKISKLACKERMHALVLVKQGEVEEVAGSKAVDCLWWVHAQIGGLVLVVAHAGNLVQVVVAKLGCDKQETVAQEAEGIGHRHRVKVLDNQAVDLALLSNNRQLEEIAFLRLTAAQGGWEAGEGGGHEEESKKCVEGPCAICTGLKQQSQKGVHMTGRGGGWPCTWMRKKKRRFVLSMATALTIGGRSARSGSLLRGMLMPTESCSPYVCHTMRPAPHTSTPGSRGTSQRSMEQEVVVRRNGRRRGEGGEKGFRCV